MKVKRGEMTEYANRAEPDTKANRVAGALDGDMDVDRLPRHQLTRHAAPLLFSPRAVQVRVEHKAIYSAVDSCFFVFLSVLHILCV